MKKVSTLRSTTSDIQTYAIHFTPLPDAWGIAIALQNSQSKSTYDIWDKRFKNSHSGKANRFFCSVSDISINSHLIQAGYSLVPVGYDRFLNGQVLSSFKVSFLILRHEM